MVRIIQLRNQLLLRLAGFRPQLAPAIQAPCATSIPEFRKALVRRVNALSK